MIGKTSLCGVKLVRGYSYIQQHSVKSRNTQFFYYRAYLAEIRSYYRYVLIPVKPGMKRPDSIGILIHTDKPARIKAFQYFGGVTSAACGTVKIYTVGLYIKRAYCFVKYNGYMRKVKFRHLSTPHRGIRIKARTDS